MKTILALAIAIVMVASFGESTAQAQTYGGGYQFGAGLVSNHGFGCCNGYNSRESQPFFARHPPVYYSHIIKRPYGISPYAVPAGITPVEMTIPTVAPVTVKNPYFSSDIDNVSSETEPQEDATPSVDHKTTMNIPVWIDNPHFVASSPLVSLVR